MVLVFRTPNSACPSSHLMLLSSCSPHHLPTPHTSYNFPGSSGFLAKCSGSWTDHPPPVSSPYGFHLRLPGNEKPEWTVKWDPRGCGSRLGGKACPSRSWEHRSQPLPQPSPTFQHLPAKLTFHSSNQRSLLGLSLTLPPALLTLHSLNATGISSLTAALSKHKRCKAPAETCTGTTAPRILG